MSRVVLVTGASRGIGREIAEAFGRNGDFVAVGFRQSAVQAEEVVQRIVLGGGRAHAFGFDQRDRDSVSALITAVEERLGPVEVLVANAGVAADAPFVLGDPDVWEDVVRTNLLGTTAVLRRVGRAMAGRRNGVIAVVGSIASTRVGPGQSSYAAAKAGLEAVVRSMASELGPFGVRVNAVVPGLIASGMADRIRSDVVEALVKQTPLRRKGTAAEVASATCFLCSPAASFITGHALVIDGGLSL